MLLWRNMVQQIIAEISTRKFYNPLRIEIRCCQRTHGPIKWNQQHCQKTIDIRGAALPKMVHTITCTCMYIHYIYTYILIHVCIYTYQYNVLACINISHYEIPIHIPTSLTCAPFLMVHLVLERPRESVLPLLIQHCIGSNRESSKNPKGRTDVSKKPFWSIAFPIYYVLLSFTCNVLFLVGSCLFLPIKSSQASVSFTFVVENIDVDKVMTSNKGDLFEYPVAKSSLRF